MIKVLIKSKIFVLITILSAISTILAMIWGNGQQLYSLSVGHLLALTNTLVMAYLTSKITDVTVSVNARKQYINKILFIQIAKFSGIAAVIYVCIRFTDAHPLLVGIGYLTYPIGIMISIFWTYFETNQGINSN